MHDVLTAARALAPQVRSLADEGEQARRLPAPLVDAFRTAGLFRMCVPKAYGGPEVDPLTVLEAIETVAVADGAAGWCVMIASTTSSLANYLPPEHAEAIFGPPGNVAGGAFAPNGRGTKGADGSVTVEGRWMWGSGTQHCQWITGGTTVDDGSFLLCFFPAAEVAIIDTWYSSGLRGTGSNDFEVHGAVVPPGRWVAPLSAQPQLDVPLARMPNFSLLAAGVAAATLGMARRAIDELVELAGGKTPTLSNRKLAEWPMAQVDVARAEAALRAARAFLFDELGRMWDEVVAGDRPSVEARARLRLACAHVGSEAARATDLAYHAGGGSSVFATSPLQRCFRDVHTATQHIMIGPRLYEQFGKLRFGVPTDTSML